MTALLEYIDLLYAIIRRFIGPYFAYVTIISKRFCYNINDKPEYSGVVYQYRQFPIIILPIPILTNMAISAQILMSISVSVHH